MQPTHICMTDSATVDHSAPSRPHDHGRVSRSQHISRRDRSALGSSGPADLGFERPAVEYTYGRDMAAGLCALRYELGTSLSFLEMSSRVAISREGINSFVTLVGHSCARG